MTPTRDPLVLLEDAFPAATPTHRSSRREGRDAPGDADGAYRAYRDGITRFMEERDVLLARN